MDSSSFTSQIFTTLLALAFVGVLAWVSLSALKRLQRGRGGSSDQGARNQVRFVHALTVGAKERVVVVSYAGDEWLLGVTAGSVNLLGRRAGDTLLPSEQGQTPSTTRTT
ncbi:MAG: flagellar biosynthetic protein FliO [Cytophagales bacterium]|nr:flagellar biosynthetic protein FliO [Rhizobacter sp.]